MMSGMPPMEAPPVGHAARTQEWMHGDGRSRAERKGGLLESLIENQQVRLDDGVQFTEATAGRHDGGWGFSRLIEQSAKSK